MPFIEAKLLQWKGEALLELKEKYLGGQKCSVLVQYKMSTFMSVLDFLSCYSMCYQVRINAVGEHQLLHNQIIHDKNKQDLMNWCKILQGANICK